MLVIYTEYNVERKFFGLKTFAGYSLFLYATFLKVRLKILILTRFFAGGASGTQERVYTGGVQRALNQ